jgi:hypothetical protein
MMRRSRVFLSWTLVLSALCLILNLPRNGGTLKSLKGPDTFYALTSRPPR